MKAKLKDLLHRVAGFLGHTKRLDMPTFLDLMCEMEQRLDLSESQPVVLSAPQAQNAIRLRWRRELISPKPAGSL